VHRGDGGSLSILNRVVAGSSPVVFRKKHVAQLEEHLNTDCHKFSDAIHCGQQITISRDNRSVGKCEYCLSPTIEGDAYYRKLCERGAGIRLSIGLGQLRLC
jgi:hypothetical protein